MKSVRERFEEIWPVPDDVTWCDASGAYWFRVESHEPTRMSAEMNIRLDTFTRCQETSDIYVSLIEEMVDELSQQAYPGDWYYRATQILWRDK